jgi:hypothetical protein
MAVDPQPNIDQVYREKFAKSAQLSQRARATIAAGITHDARNSRRSRSISIAPKARGSGTSMAMS